MKSKSKRKWKRISCGCCNGIKWGGEQPIECEYCDGTGVLFVSEKDRLALYPGGPFKGMEKGLYAKTK